MRFTTISKALFLLSALAMAGVGQTTFSKCDVSQDGNTNVAEAQLIVNEGLGIAPAANDLNGDGVVNVVDAQIVMNAVLGLGCVAAPVAQISSLSETTANPFDQFTITGTGFDPANAAISVLFIPESDGLPIAVPAFAATSTTVQIAVPPFFNTVTGTFTAGTVDVQVLQLEGSTLATSNIVTGFEINAPPAVPAGVPVGEYTSEFLAASLIVSASIQNDAATNSSVANLAADLAQYDTDMNSVVSAIATISNDPSQSVTLSTADGLTFSLNAQVLALSDQLCLTYVQQFENQLNAFLSTDSTPALQGTRSELAQRAVLSGPGPDPKQADSCLAQYGADGYHSGICQMLQTRENVAKLAPPTVQAIAAIDGPVSADFVGSYQAQYLAAPDMPSAQNAAQANLLVWGGAAPNNAALATAQPPPSLYDSLSTTLKQVFNSLVLAGKAILLSALDALNIHTDTSAVSPTPPPQAPQKGTVLSCGTPTTPSCKAQPPGGQLRARASETSCATPVNAYQIVSGGVLTTELAAPLSEQVTNVSAITIPPATSCTFAQMEASYDYCFAEYTAAADACDVGSSTQELQCLNRVNHDYSCSYSCSLTGGSDLSPPAISPLASRSLQQYTLAIGTSGTGTGIVSPPSPPGTPCGTNCWSYPAGTSVKLTAIPDSGSTFTNWSGGGCSENGACAVIMDANQSVTATLDLSSGYTYTGTIETTITSTLTPSSGCTLSPGLILQKSAAPAQLIASAPLHGGSGFSGNLTVGPRAVTAAIPKLTCTNPDGTTTTIPGTRRISSGPGSAFSIGGTSDGHFISISQETRNLFCAGTSTCSVSGTVSVLASKVVVTLNITSSIASAAGAVTSETTLTLTETEQ